MRIHRMSIEVKRSRWAGDLPAASEADERTRFLPIYPKMTDADVARVIEAVKDVVEKWRS
ncbi:MAG: DegT/DnrJ/EryC1/StrS family aminotransferase [Waddliaceae bacterium]